jgi:hypothetical protein
VSRSQDILRALVLVAALLGPRPARAQVPVPSAPSTAAEESAPTWSGTASIAGYFIPDDSDYVQPAVSADRSWLHLEARYNYEAQKTASFWGGVNFETGERVTLALTPRFGIVTGDTDGVAPGLRLSISSWKLELYSESEWVFDHADSSESFFYTWSELTLQPLDWFRFGMVTQRTRAYQTDRYIQRGLLAGVTWKRTTLTGHLFEPFGSNKATVVAIAIDF